MEFPVPNMEELEEIFQLTEEAWRNPGIDTWMILADKLYSETFDSSTTNEEEEEMMEKSDDEAGFILFDDVLRALVEVSWEAWVSDQERCRSCIEIGLMGDMKNGIPPFLNMRAGSAHLELALFLERMGEISLTHNAQALGRILLLFHMSEAFIRPGMATAAFLLHVWIGDATNLNDILLRNHPHRGLQMATYGMTRDSFINSIRSSKKQFQDRDCLDTLYSFMENDDAEMTLGELRNAIGHHNLDIIEGEVRLGWMKGYPDWEPNMLKSIPPDDMKDIIWGTRGLVVTLHAWERLMMMVFFPPDDLDDFDSTALAENLSKGFEPEFVKWLGARAL